LGGIVIVMLRVISKQSGVCALRFRRTSAVGLATLLAVLAAGSAAQSATPTASAAGQLGVGVTITADLRKFAASQPLAAAPGSTAAPRVSRETENGQAYTLLYY
jgi:hypothetical protein